MIRFAAELRSLVGNEGGFVHKSFIGKAIGGLVKTAIPIVGQITSGISEVKSFLGGGGQIQTARPTVPRVQTARVTMFSEVEKEAGREFKFPNGFANGLGVHGDGERGPCLPPLVRGPRGDCLFPPSPVGAARLGGTAVMGIHGAGVVAGSEIIDRATCLRGMHLGNDGICYKKGAITNKERMWPAGAKPLLTGGEMNAIRTADTARGRVARAAGRLGIVPKAPRKRRVPTGHKAKLVHA